MAPEPSYRWLRIAGLVTLALAAALAVYAWRHAAEEQRRRDDVGARVQETMRQIEAEAQRMENAAAAQ
ncbi:hypothetical protein ACG3SL_02390 [Sphingomonas sp. CJ20]